MIREGKTGVQGFSILEIKRGELMVKMNADKVREPTSRVHEVLACSYQMHLIVMHSEVS